MFTCIHKYYTLDNWIQFLYHTPDLDDTIYNYISITSGIGKSDLEKLSGFNLASIKMLIELFDIKIDIIYVEIEKRKKNKK